MSLRKQLINIDGSLLEGGGQILRNAVVLSCLLGQPIRVSRIRAGRSKPGLKEQHLRGLELVRDICSGKLIGANFDSMNIEFWPGKIRGGHYSAEVRTAGSISLLLQVALPCCLFADSDTTLYLTGGTNAEMAPQIDYTTEVFRPILEKFGGTFDFDLVRRGYFPRGGGEVVVNIKPVQHLTAIEMTEQGRLSSVYGWSFVAGSAPLHLANGMADGAARQFEDVCQKIDIQQYKEDEKVAPDNCSGIVVVAETDSGCIFGGSKLGNRKQNAQDTGRGAADEILSALDQGACVDDHTQDQIIILMALAQGRSKIRIGAMTLHTQTAIYVAERMANVKFDIRIDGNSTVIECDGVGL